LINAFNSESLNVALVVTGVSLQHNAWLPISVSKSLGLMVCMALNFVIKNYFNSIIKVERISETSNPSIEGFLQKYFILLTPISVSTILLRHQGSYFCVWHNLPTGPFLFYLHQSICFANSLKYL
jgi:hypothetical protein